MNWLTRKLLTRRRLNAASEIRDYREAFEEAVLAATATAAPFSDQLVQDVRARFDKLDAEVGTALTPKQFANLMNQAEAAWELRAYVVPQGELEVQAITAINTMAEWPVPSRALDALRTAVLPKIACNSPGNVAELSASRGALHSVFSEYSSWSDYFDDYNDDMQKIAYSLTVLIVLSLSGALLLVPRGLVTWGLLAAGAAGAFVSVISKLPGLSITGEDYAPYKRVILRRVCTGLAATVIGCGLLVSGIATVNLPFVGNLSTLIATCSGESPALTAVDISTRCGSAGVFVLVAVAMLFGLSERALSSLEDRVFPNKE